MVELKNGYCFNLKPFKGFLNEKTWKGTNCKILVIDGFLETVSEINNILNESARTKIPLCIFAHGFSEEIIATIKLNNDKNNFNIMPIKIEAQVENINLLNDLSVVCDCDMVSFLKGEQVQFVNYDNLSIIDRITCFENEINIENNKSFSKINSHIRFLLKKRQENQSVEDIVNILDKRIKSLFSQIVVVNLPNLSDIKKNEIKTKIDICIRTTKTLTNYGIIELNTFKEELLKLNCKNHSEKILKQCFIDLTSLLKENNDFIPSLSMFVGTFLSFKQLLELLSANGFIENIN